MILLTRNYLILPSRYKDYKYLIKNIRNPPPKKKIPGRTFFYFIFNTHIYRLRIYFWLKLDRLDPLPLPQWLSVFLYEELISSLFSNPRVLTSSFPPVVVQAVLSIVLYPASTPWLLSTTSVLGSFYKATQFFIRSYPVIAIFHSTSDQIFFAGFFSQISLVCSHRIWLLPIHPIRIKYDWSDRNSHITLFLVLFVFCCLILLRICSCSCVYP